MSILIAYFIAGICAAGFVTICLTTAYNELSAKRNCLVDLNAREAVEEKTNKVKGGENQRDKRMISVLLTLCM